MSPRKKKQPKLQIIPLGGVLEIGKNMTAFALDDQILVVDSGLMFPEEEMLGVDLVIPNVSYIEQHRDRFRAIKRRFLDAFHRTNLAYARLRALRQQRRRARLADERAALQAVEQAICAREALEDRYASQGLVAVPLYLDGLAVNVQFQCPGSTAMQSMRVVSSCGQALAFALPVPVVRRRLK